MSHAKIARGTAAYTRLCIAMLFAGLSTFSILYAVQPLLPLFSRDYGVKAEEASLAVSLTTGSMAIALLAAGMVSDRVGRRPMMIVSLFLAATLTILSAALPGWHSLLAARFACGLVLAGVPAVAMAYISEEVEDSAIGHAMGLYIAGSGMGGMSGRVLVSLITQYSNWHLALGITGGLSLVIAVIFWRTIPHSRQFHPRHQSVGIYIAGFGRLFADRAMPWLFAEGFLVMGAFIGIYNFVGFQLLAPPYSLSQALVGAISLLFVIGSFSSVVAGSIASRLGPRKSLWAPFAIVLVGACLSAFSPLPVLILGIAIVAIGFFAGHSIASAWVSRRARADRAQATACYLFFYYMGSSVLGSAAGYAWTRAGWQGVAAFTALLMVVALCIAARLYTVLPLPANIHAPLKDAPL